MEATLLFKEGDVTLPISGIQTSIQVDWGNGSLVTYSSGQDVSGTTLSMPGAPYFVSTLASNIPAQNIAIDTSGNIYVVGFNGSNINKIDGSGYVTPLAVTDALSNLNGVAVDKNGNVYVTEFNTNNIRKIDISGYVTTLPNTGNNPLFINPTNIIVDANDNIYFDESYNNRIYKITPDGSINVLAGVSGVPAYLDGSGEQARFANPKGLAIDSNGNIFVADSLNNRIRKITPNGVVSTIAGNGETSTVGSLVDGTGVDASFYGPTGVAIDSNNNIFVVDRNNYRIRKITPPTGYTWDSPESSIIPGTPGSGGVVTTIAGGGASTNGFGANISLNDPFDIAVDSRSNIYATNFGSIIKLNSVATVKVYGDYTTFGKGPSSWPGASYILDVSGWRSNTALVNVSGAFNGATAFIGKAAASWDVSGFTDMSYMFYGATIFNQNLDNWSPSACQDMSYMFEGATAQYINGRFINDIRAWPVGAVTNSERFFYTNGVDMTLVDPRSPFYRSPMIFKFNNPVSVNLPISGINGTTEISGPFTVTASGSSSYVINGSNNPTLNLLRGFTYTFNVNAPGHPFWIQTIPGQRSPVNVYSSGITNGGASVGTISFTVPYNAPSILYYVCQFHSSMAGIIRISTSDIQVFWGGYSEFDNGALKSYISGQEVSDTIMDSYIVSTLAGNGNTNYADGSGESATFWNPYGVAVDSNGYIYVADTNNNRIRKITPDGVVSTLAGSAMSGSTDGPGESATFDYPQSVAVDSNGYVYVADRNNRKIRKITPGGVVSTLAGSGSFGSRDGSGGSATFTTPSGVAVDLNGYVYVADRITNKIRKITPEGDVSTLAGSGSVGSTDGSGGTASFSFPESVAVDSNGYVYVADTNNYKIRKITPGGVVSTLAGSVMPGSTDGSGSDAGFSSPTGIAVDSNGYVYVTDSINYNIRKITPEGVVSTVAGGSFGFTDGTGGSVAFIDPYGVAVDSNGNVYIADAGNNRIRKMIIAYEVKVYGDFTGFGNGSSSWQGATNILDVTGWESNTALVDVSGAFNGATAFLGNTASSWDVSRLTNMSYMFYGATAFNGNLSSWNTGAATNMSHMFEGATAQYNNNLLKYNIGSWAVGGVTNFTRFLYTGGQDTTLLDPRSPFFEFPATGIPATFVFTTGGAVTLPISGIDSSGIHVYWGSGPTRYYKNGASISNTVSGNNQVIVWGNYSSFGNGAASWPGATTLLDVSGWGSNTILVDVSGAFNGATAFLGTTAASWDVSKFTNMSYMFFGASSFTTDLSGWTNNVGPLRPADYANFLTSGTTTNPKSPFYIGRSVDDGLTADQFTNLLTTNIGKPNPPFQIDNAVYGTVGTRLYKIKNSVVSTLATFASPAIGAMYRIDSKIFGIQGKKLFSCDVSSGDAINSSAGTFIGDPSEFMTLDASGNLYAFDNSGNLYRYSRRGTPGLNIIFTDLSNAIISTISCDGGKIYGVTEQGNILLYDVTTGSPTIVSPQVSPRVKVMPREGASQLLDSLLAYKGNLYVYQVEKDVGDSIVCLELNNGIFVGFSIVWNFNPSSAPLNGYDPVGRLFVDASSNIMYGICSNGGAGLGKGLYGAGTLFAIDLDISGSGPTNLPGPPKFTVLVNYCSADYTRGAIPQSFSITNETGNAFVVTSGGQDSSVTPLHVGPRVNGSNYVVGSSGLPGYTANCFNKGTRILCAEDKWIPIEDLRVGCLIQTYRHGLRPIAKIIKGFMINNPDIWHSCMYTGKREGFEPLVITGGHGLLVDYLTESQQRAQASYWGTDEVVIDDLTVMIVPVSANFTKIEGRSLYTYYHFALENDGDNDRRYGVYANGFLAETPSLNQLRAAE